VGVVMTADQKMIHGYLSDIASKLDAAEKKLTEARRMFRVGRLDVALECANEADHLASNDLGDHHLGEVDA
jgi:hypothetical protein